MPEGLKKDNITDMEQKTLDVAMKHSHTTFVGLLIIAMLISVVFIFLNKNKRKGSPKWLKISHMVLGTFTLITGIYLMLNAPGGSQPLYWFKLVLVFIAMFLGIAGSRKKNAPMGLGSLVLLLGIMALTYVKPSFLLTQPDGLASDDEIEQVIAGRNGSRETGGNETIEERDLRIGKSLYYKYDCNTCHGDDGAFGFQGAKDLSESVLSDEEIGDMIRNGKGLMPAVEGIGDTEVDLLITYSKSFRK